MKKWWDIAAKAAAFTVVCAYVSTSAAAEEPGRIGSTSLCGDMYLRALAPEKIRALSWQSRDALSLASPAQRALPQIWDDPEIVLASKLDHIVFGPGEGFRAQAYISSHSQLSWGEDFESVKRNLTQIAKAIDISARPAIQNMEKRLNRLQPLSQKPTVLYLDRSGASAGPGTYVDAVIKAAGGINIITKGSWIKPDLETLLGLKPDLILTSYFDDGYDSVNANPVRHQAVMDFINGHARLDIPGALWPCAGPELVTAAEMLNRKIRALK